jgi:high-affinity iron transporter
MQRQSIPTWRRFRILMTALFLLSSFHSRAWAAADTQSASEERLLPIIGGALVAAGEHQWIKAAEELVLFENEWKGMKFPALADPAKVNSALTETKQALVDAEQHPDSTFQAFSKLTKATNEFIAAEKKLEISGDGKKLAKGLLPLLDQTLAEIHQNEWARASAHYKQFMNGWSKAEAGIRADNAGIYGALETKLSLARISLQAEPPQADSAISRLTNLIQTLEDYVNDKASSAPSSTTEKLTLADLLALLEKAQQSMSAGQFSAAAEDMQSFISYWPTVEGEVRTRSASVYTDIENQMAEASSYLVSNPPKTDQAQQVIARMQESLKPFVSTAGYTAWDAGLVLLREGFEALLVLAALLAFLHRTGNGSKQSYIWGGALAGLVLSGGLAVILTFTIASVASGSTRELLEGLTGIVSVILMLTVGAWLHGKSNVKAWNQYIHDQIGMALASGKLWYLLVISGLSILREGAETTIFYIGMAPSMEPLQMLLGIAGALLLLIVLGIIVVRGSVRIPIRPFFLGATIFIYYLVIKFLGESIHSLQIAGMIKSHVSGMLPTWSWLGIYPTWETSVPQLLVLVFIGVQLARFNRKNRKSTDLMISEKPSAS